MVPDLAGVAARVPTEDWEAAVRFGGELLRSAGCVAPGYIEAMVAARAEFGPYMVVAPGVAMPHARPEAGVLRPGVAVLTLDRPVAFGHKSNDPVDIIVAFAAMDKDEHLQRLSWIAALVGDSERLGAMRSASTDAELQVALADKDRE